MDEGNSDYILFVEMVAQHFDTIWSYINALTQIHSRDEHPKRGPSGDILYHIANSYGWKLQNGRESSDLWLYKLGTDQEGKYGSTGSMFSLTHEDQTKQVWRRIVNNLPYLLKTKGTTRSVKALMSIFGIPNTLISIKEYGGPSVSVDKPHITKDFFRYSLNFTGSNYIEMNRRVIPPESGSWGGVARVPDTVEFRFRTAYSSSVSMSLWSVLSPDRTKVYSNLELVHVNPTGSVSGSYSYGYLRLTQAQLSGSTYISSSVTTGQVPVFDNDFWSVRVYTDTPIAGSTLSGSIYVQVKKASDYIAGKLVHSASAVWSGNYSMLQTWGSDTSTSNSPLHLILGGTTGSSGRFIGTLDGYKEYLTVMCLTLQLTMEIQKQAVSTLCTDTTLWV
jgi:hypothetical protein